VDFREAQDFLYSLIDYEKKPGLPHDLEGFKRFLKEIGSPQDELNEVIHIVGTKGKGSCGAHLVAALSSLGKRVGLFTSPHLVDIRERITINFNKIPEDRFADYVERLSSYAKGKKGIRTVFEILTATALLYFRDEKVDVAVFEAGLGGRLDATNVFKDKVTVITPISFDHTNILGKTLNSIAREKAAVIPEGGKVFTSEQEPEVMEVIKGITRERNAHLFILREQVSYRVEKVSLEGTEVSVNFKNNQHKFYTPLLGRFQAQNLALASSCLLEMGYSPFSFDKVSLRGRLEILRESPYLVVDGAHNPYAMRSLIDSVEEIFPYRNLIVVFGASKDKDIPRLIEIIAPAVDILIITRALNPRACTPWEIVEEAKEERISKIKVVEHPVKAVELALKMADNGDMILVTGSFYLVGDVLNKFG
jgi:dihydrofolate synthase/folylpolyglutamate synthase